MKSNVKPLKDSQKKVGEYDSILDLYTPHSKKVTGLTKTARFGLPIVEESFSTLRVRDESSVKNEDFNTYSQVVSKKRNTTMDIARDADQNLEQAQQALISIQTQREVRRCSQVMTNQRRVKEKEKLFKLFSTVNSN